MNTLISAKELRASLPQVVKKVRRGARFTVVYRSRPAFQILPVEASAEELPPLDKDPIYRAKPVGRSRAGLSFCDHDSILYGR